MSADNTAGADVAAVPAPIFLRVVRGEPTAEEIAALVTVFATMSGGAADDTVAVAEWSSPERLHRPAVFAGGPDAWWASGLPR